MKSFYLIYHISLPDSAKISFIGTITRSIRFFLGTHFGRDCSVGLQRVEGDGPCHLGYTFSPAPIEEVDIEWMRGIYKNKKTAHTDAMRLYPDPQYWPKWAQDDLQEFANFRRAVTLNLLNK